MNYKKAIEILEIDIIENYINPENLNKQYRKMALKYHPDKNGNTELSTQKFQLINEAYNFLKKNTTFNDNDNDNDNNDNDNDNDNDNIYFNVLDNFVKSVMEGNYIDIIVKIVNEILTNGKKVSFKMFNDLDKDIVLNIYLFLSRYKSILHLNDDLLEVVKQIVLNKFENVEIYKLNPSINDLIENKFYKLFIDEKLYLVPLWHKESYFYNSNCEIIAICEPDLPDNIKIDDDNNLIVDISISCNDLIELLREEKPISFYIGNNLFTILLENLNLKKEQYIILKEKGLVNITKNIYDLTNKSDIIVKIIFV